MNDTPDSLMADTTVSASVECTIKYNTHKLSLRVSAINIILYMDTTATYP
jgi:hypothetical protein